MHLCPSKIQSRDQIEATSLFMYMHATQELGRTRVQKIIHGPSTRIICLEEKMHPMPV